MDKIDLTNEHYKILSMRHAASEICVGHSWMPVKGSDEIECSTCKVTAKPFPLAGNDEGVLTYFYFGECWTGWDVRSTDVCQPLEKS